jgi:hypothetical protein
MRAVYFRSLVIAVAAVLTLAGTAGAQQTSTPILNSLEVRQLVAHGEPEDNARLSAHFAALAEQYTAEANRHLSMAQGFVGNPSRNLGSGMSAHCKRLADLNTQEATTLRELAAYHTKLAGGETATPPAGAARFHSGAGAPAPTKRDLAALAAKASTPADHRALEEYFRTLAARYLGEAEARDAFAQTLRGTRIEQSSALHTYLAELARAAAKEANAAAEMHRQLADIAK